MAANGYARVLLAAALMCLLVASAPRAAAISCGQVVTGIAPCYRYIIGAAPVPGFPCCNGIRGIQIATPTTADRRTACTCLKNIAARFTGLNPARAAGLPAQCGVRVGYPISTSTDCSRVQ